VVISWEVAQKAPRGSQGANFVTDGEVDDAALPVHPRAAELIGGHVLTQHRLHDAGTGQAEEGVGGLDHEAALPRQVRTTTSVVAEHAHDARHHAADLAERGKRLRIAVEAADACRHERPSAIVHADQRHPLPAGQANEVGQLRAVGRVHRARAKREIVTVKSNLATLYLDHCRH